MFFSLSFKSDILLFYWQMFICCNGIPTVLNLKNLWPIEINKIQNNAI